LAPTRHRSDREPDFVRHLGRFGDAVALIGPAGTLTYAELDAAVDRLAEELSGPRRLALVAGANTPERLIGYLGALRAGHPVLLCGEPGAPSLTERYNPGIVIGGGDGGGVVHIRNAEPACPLHADLALLLTTSGSTGSAKLVRLSRANLQANAESIVEYLGITGDDRAVTTLPMYYSYGLSVIHSHLLRGASLILTECSVTDADFPRLLLEHGATSFAGVPHTFDLLDRVGFSGDRFPRLRYITQAGGRLAPDRVRHYAALGREHGWDFFVMYGQTEATARMAYLPPALAIDNPKCIGVAIPGGSLRIDPVSDEPGSGVGELVYSGPNVMLGYAQEVADLALGATLSELRTGDLGRLTSGLFEVVGRRNRFLKLYGLRVDLQRVEQLLAEQGLTAHCGGDDDGLVVAVIDASDVPSPASLRDSIAATCGLPVHAIRVIVVADVPRLDNGKVDYAALRDLAVTAVPGPRVPVDTPGPAAAEPATATGRAVDVAAVYATVLGRDDVGEESTFAGLGGDSLSYVEASVRLEQVLGTLPPGWHAMAVRELAQVRAAAGQPSWLRRLESSVAVRFGAMLLVVGSHTGLFNLRGGAHVLLAVLGFNVGRLHVSEPVRRTRAKRIAASVARIGIPAVIWSGLLWVHEDRETWLNVVFAGWFSDSTANFVWQLWFIDTVVYTMLAVLVVLSTPWGDRLVRRFPFGFPVALIGMGAMFRFDLVPFLDLSYRGFNSPNTLLVCSWLFAIGWAASKARHTWQRLLLTMITVALTWGYIGNLQWELTIIGGVTLLIWMPSIPSIRVVNEVAAVVAGASLYIYLTHFAVLDRVGIYLTRLSPQLESAAPIVGFVASFVVGIAVARVAAWVEVQVTRPWRRRRVAAAEPSTAGVL
jgi:acyl-CoA synthetase (AMP-forming)/AMP-acid ligase II